MSDAQRYPHNKLYLDQTAAKDGWVFKGLSLQHSECLANLNPCVIKQVAAQTQECHMKSNMLATSYANPSIGAMK